MTDGTDAILRPLTELISELWQNGQKEHIMPPTVTKVVKPTITTTKAKVVTPTQTRTNGDGGKLNLFDAAMPIGEVKTGGYKFLIFGDSGTGKTTLGCSFPKPLFFIRPEEVEEGHKSVIDVEGVFIPMDPSTGRTIPLTDPDQIEDIIDGQRRTGKYATVLLDGATCLQDLVVRKCMGWKDTKIKLLWGDVPQQDWGKINILFQKLMRDLLRLADQGTHVVIVAAERTINPKEDAEVGTPKIMAAMTPASTDWLHRNCDYNIHTHVCQGKRQEEINVGGKITVVTKPSGKREYHCHLEEPTGMIGTKFRIPRGAYKPADIANPTFEILESLILGAYEEPAE